MNKLLTILLTICAISFFSCDDNDNDKKKETNTCDPAACEMAEHATEMGCDDTGHCVVKSCADTFKVAEDAKSCEANEPACICEQVCKENEDCIKGEDGACGCRAKDKPTTCDPICEEDKECKCEEDKCECKEKDAQTEECFCDEEKKVVCPEGKKEACTDSAPVEDSCKDKVEGAECDENKTCQKDENESLVCKDKPADPIE